MPEKNKFDLSDCKQKQNKTTPGQLSVEGWAVELKALNGTVKKANNSWKFNLSNSCQCHTRKNSSIKVGLTKFLN